MAHPSPGAELCVHLRTATAPAAFETVYVLDEQAGITDAVIRCGECGAHVLIEMLDWRGSGFAERVYRTSLVDAADAGRYLHDRARGSCDVRRAGAETHALLTLARLTPWLLAMDERASTVLGAARLPDDTDIPTQSWRERLGDRRAQGGEESPFWAHFARSSTRIE